MQLDPELTRVVISDVHGNYEALYKLLRDTGILDSRGERNEGFHVVQVGDLVNMVDSTKASDLVTVGMGRQSMDCILCGNHELWYVWSLQAGIFNGMTRTPEPELIRILNKMSREGQFRPSTDVDNWLVTHAGVHRNYQQSLPATASACSSEINRRFEHKIIDRKEDPLFDSVGHVRSLGRDKRAGGIFWCDILELVQGASRLPQIVGHTPPSVRRPIEVSYNRLWAIDPGRPKVAALYKKGKDSEWRSICAEARRKD